MAVLFISEAKLKEASLINENVDMKVVTPTILLVQDMYIHPILGSDLYDELKSEVTAGSVSAANKTLLDNYIRPALIWWVMYEAPVALSYKFGNQSVGIEGDASGKPPKLEELLKISERYRNNAEWYTERLRTFLMENRTTYPAYSSNNELDDLRPGDSGYDCGMYLE